MEASTDALFKELGLLRWLSGYTRLAAKPDHLSSISGTHRVEENGLPHELSSDRSCMLWHAYVTLPLPHTTYIDVINGFF